MPTTVPQCDSCGRFTTNSVVYTHSATPWNGPTEIRLCARCTKLKVDTLLEAASDFLVAARDGIEPVLNHTAAKIMITRAERFGWINPNLGTLVIPPELADRIPPRLTDGTPVLVDPPL